MRSLAVALRGVARTGEAAGIALTGAGWALAAAREVIAAGGHPALCDADLAAADAVVYAGDSLEELVRAARASRRRPLAALLPEALHESAYAVPGVDALAVVATAAALPDALGARLPAGCTRLAAGLPALRPSFCHALVEGTARRASALAVLAPLERATAPLLVVMQAQLVARLALAHGLTLDRRVAPELAATLAAGAGMGRAAGDRRASRAAFAYAGTLAIGRAAELRFSGAAVLPRPAR